MGGKRTRPGESGGEQDRYENAYEAERNAMLEENRQRMLELGLLEDAKIFQRRAVRPYKPKVMHNPSDSLRRSSRLQGTTKVSYKDTPQFAAYVPKTGPVRHVVHSAPVRRSSRLQGTTTVSYKEQLDDKGVPSQVPIDSEDD